MIMTSSLKANKIATVASRLARRSHAAIFSHSQQPRIVRTFGLEPRLTQPCHFSAPIRSFSTKPDSEEKDENTGMLENVRKTVLSTVITPQNQFYALLAGGTFGAYLISKTLLSLTTFFTHLNPQVVAKYGFYTGFGTATCKSLVLVLVFYGRTTLICSVFPI
jgi:hypothetical protein